RLPLMLANSQAGLKAYRDRGFRPQQAAVIPNGIDIDMFRPDTEAGLAVRKGWGIAPDSLLIGIVGRLMPVKDHPLFLQAAARLAKDNPSLRFVCVGSGPDDYTRELGERADSLGLKDKVVWAGARRDMRAVYNALDILCLSSKSEGFPNVVAEAMACGVPPIATNVGDVEMIVGGAGKIAGKIVSVATPEALAAALSELMSLASEARYNLGLEARARIVEDFSIEAMIQRTEHYLETLCLGENRRRLAA
ncbi:MAG: glycosyltransferase, partial [Geminicoccaceae bacterium]